MHDLIIPPRQLTQMLQFATSCRPEEACGLILGTSKGQRAMVTDVVYARNVYDGDRRRGYAIDPRVLAKEMHRGRSGEESVVGVFHSHPSSQPIPSLRDRDAAWPGLSYLILGMDGEASWQMRSWRRSSTEAAMREEDIIVLNSEDPS